jgi:ElaB/YqjD/DUF883 family membrane-anchored ribosome-binding protein
MADDTPPDLNAEVRALLARSKELRESAAENMRQSAEALAKAERLLEEADARARAAEREGRRPKSG